MKTSIIILILTFLIPFSASSQNDTIPFGAYGDKYLGEVNKDGLPHGQGESFSSHGGGYVGHWKNGVYHGYGIKTWHNGDVYNGNWKLGNRHGQGRMSWQVSFFHDGQWKNDNQHGKGIIVYPGGNSRKGKWVHGLMHGKGEYQTERDGEAHEDEYWHGRKIQQPITYY